MSLLSATNQAPDLACSVGLPYTWPCGIFGSLLPPAQTCCLLDWAILNSDPYFGLYLTASLLGLLESALLDMNGDQFRALLAQMTSSRRSKGAEQGGVLPEWLLLCRALGGDGGEVSWESFCRGWLHAATGENICQTANC